MKKPKSTGPSPGILDQAGRNPLHLAVIDRDRASFELHLKNPEYLNARDAGGWTPLHYAAQNHDLDYARDLVTAGAEIDPQDENGNTPLSNAVFSFEEGSPDLIPFLLDRGADPRIENAYGISPLDLARSIANTSVSQFFSPYPEEP